MFLLSRRVLPDGFHYNFLAPDGLDLELGHIETVRASKHLTHGLVYIVGGDGAGVAVDMNDLGVCRIAFTSNYCSRLDSVPRTHYRRARLLPL